MKRFNKLIIILGLLLGIVSPLVTPGFAQEPPTSTADFVPGEVLVKFQPHVNREAAQRSLHSANIRVTKVSPYSGVIRVRVEPGREQEMINKLLARGDVEFATVNHFVQAHEIPDDEFYDGQWALPKIEAPAAWDISTGGSNVVIAILDSGVDLDHPDLQANIVPGIDIVNGDNDPDDDYYRSHGTHVAGIAAGIGNNSIGIAGVSWGAKIMPVKVLDGTGGGTTGDVSDGIIWAADNGANVINMSMGARGSSWPCNWDDVENALDYAVGKGVLVVVSAGNDGQYGVNCPGAYDQVMAVGSTTSSDARSYFSNYGPRLDIAAPGSGIISTIRVSYGSYGSLDGTSMAAPHVSGLAALIWSVAPSLTRTQVIDIIQDNAVDLGTSGWDQYFGHGRINVWKTLQALSFQSSPSQLTLFLDDEQSQTSGFIQVISLNTDVITWTATISPTVSWLNVSPPVSGTISAASSPTPITLLAQSTTLTYTDTPTTTTLVVTGTTAAGANLTTSSNVQLIFQSEIYRYYFPLIFKN